MSGQAITASGPIHATQRARALLAALDLKPDQTDALRTLPADRLLQATETTDPVLGKGPLFFGPVLDQVVLQRHPFYPDATPQSAAIPMIVGNTHDETRGLLRDPRNFTLSWDDLPAKLEADMLSDLSPEYVIARYRQLYPVDARPPDRRRAAGQTGLAHLDVRARLSVAGRRRPAGRLPHA
jgi:para-nitrobenzyl esterase